MGRLKIWDGVSLPEVGDDVLVHLSREDLWIPHQVVGFQVDRWETGWRIEVKLEASADKRSSKNSRLLQDCYPLTTQLEDLPVSGCGKTPRQLAADKRAGMSNGPSGRPVEEVDHAGE